MAAANRLDDIDAVDDKVQAADEKLFDELEAFMEGSSIRLVDYSFTRRLNHETGILRYSSATNHRGTHPPALHVLEWIRDHGPDSYGVVYVHDDEDVGERAKQGARTGENYSRAFRVWVLKDRVIREVNDVLLSPVPFDP